MCTSFFNVNCVRTRLRLWFQFSVKSASILYTSNCFSGKFSSFRWFSHLFFNLQQIYIKMLSAWIHLKRYIIGTHSHLQHFSVGLRTIPYRPGLVHTGGTITHYRILLNIFSWCLCVLFNSYRMCCCASPWMAKWNLYG